MRSEPRALPGGLSRREAVAIARKREEVAKGRLLSLLVPSSRLGLAAGLATNQQSRSERSTSAYAQYKYLEAAGDQAWSGPAVGR